MQQVNASRHDYTRTNLEKRFRLTPEDVYILPVIRDHFFVRTVTHRNGDGVVVELLGTPENVTVAGYVYEFLVGAYKRCFRDFQFYSGKPLNARQAYYLGLMRGLMEQLEKNRKVVEVGMGLVVVPDAGLAKYVKGLYPRLTTGKRYTAGRIDPATYGAGVAAGRDLKIRRGLDGPATKSGLYLGK